MTDRRAHRNGQGPQRYDRVGVPRSLKCETVVEGAKRSANVRNGCRRCEAGGEGAKASMIVRIIDPYTDDCYTWKHAQPVTA